MTNNREHNATSKEKTRDLETDDKTPTMYLMDNRQQAALCPMCDRPVLLTETGWIADDGFYHDGCKPLTRRRQCA